MSNVDHAATLTELLGLVDERFQAALHAGIARLATSQVTPSPHQRAEAIMATSPRPNCENEEWWVNQITTAIQEASNDTLERGRKRTAEVQAALQAALEDLARVKQERDAFALALQYRCPVCGGEGAVTGCGPNDEPVLYECANCSPANRHLAAHDRAVAARVLYAVRRYVDDCSSDKISEIAAQYERGEREVPSE